ncbi:hypothetical protein EZV62_001519 [Acer yangbiense]|uniref:Tf2-1-like SH3-like domain-containing protein n=1 Tax=Acer yangbiense TaxID=1000413 RepID=A0A5C7IUA0_9ROSI|nr:hypothetical protein EZV62_001519 [Acer yangbiense]
MFKKKVRSQRLGVPEALTLPSSVLAKIRTVAYKLQLPHDSLIHPVFHVSQLKKKIEEPIVVSQDLPHTGSDSQILVYPIAILARKIIKRRNQVVVQFLVQWSNSKPEDAS